MKKFIAGAIGAGVLVSGGGNLILEVGNAEAAADDGTVIVTEIVDGDTIKVNLAGVTETVRLIGIDTPEADECGYTEATDALAVLLGGNNVTLTGGARVDRDRYDRLLRYVNITQTDGTLADIGLAMIDRSWAIARYDSRDGYGSHPLEARYVAADEATPDQFTVACDPDEELPAFHEDHFEPAPDDDAAEAVEDDNPYDDGGPRNADGSCPPGGCTPDNPNPDLNNNPYDDGGPRNADGSCPPGGCR